MVCNVVKCLDEEMFLFFESFGRILNAKMGECRLFLTSSFRIRQATEWPMTGRCPLSCECRRKQRAQAERCFVGGLIQTIGKWKSIFLGVFNASGWVFEWFDDF